MPDEATRDQELRQELADLHRKLESTTQGSPEKDLLGHVMNDVIKVASGEELHPEENETLKEHLDEQASSFEARHPRTAGVLREIMDVLGRLGI